MKKEEPKTRTTIWKKTTNNVSLFSWLWVKTPQFDRLEVNRWKACLSHSDTLGLAPDEAVQRFAASHRGAVRRRVICTCRVELSRHPVDRSSNTFKWKFRPTCFNDRRLGRTLASALYPSSHLRIWSGARCKRTLINNADTFLLQHPSLVSAVVEH